MLQNPQIRQNIHDDSNVFNILSLILCKQLNVVSQLLSLNYNDIVERNIKLRNIGDRYYIQMTVTTLY